jgi:Eukaryotic translation initiation factor 3 subunit 7 (eIF-3)
MVRKRGEKQYMTAYALNEWDSKLAGANEWRQKIDSQRGAVLATELKNNSAKLAKWTAQSIIAGADQVCGLDACISDIILLITLLLLEFSTSSSSEGLAQSQISFDKFVGYVQSSKHKQCVGAC